MTNKTQCPECFTIFVITDEQLIRSKGKVRCGHCRSTFDALLMSVETNPETSVDTKDIQPQEAVNKTPEQIEGSAARSQLDSILSTPDSNESPNNASISKSSGSFREPESRTEIDSPPPIEGDTRPRTESFQSTAGSKDNDLAQHKTTELDSSGSNKEDEGNAFQNPNEKYSSVLRSDKLFSEAAEIIDNSPSFSMDAFTGSRIVEQELERPISKIDVQHEHHETKNGEEPSAIEKEPSDIEKEPSALLKKPSDAYQKSSGTFEEPLTVYEEPTSFDAKTNPIGSEPTSVEPMPLSDAGEPLPVDRKPSIADNETTSTDKQPSEIASISEKSLADALAVIEDTPSFYYEEPATFDAEADSVPIEPVVAEPTPLNEESGSTSEDQETLAADNETSFTDIEQSETNAIADVGLADALAVIEDTPSFDIADYSESNSNDTIASDQNKDKTGKPLEPSIKARVNQQDETLSDAFSVIDQTPSFNIEDYSQSAFDDVEADDEDDELEPKSEILESLATESDLELPAQAIEEEPSEADIEESSQAPSLLETNSEKPPQTELFKNESQESSLLQEAENSSAVESPSEEDQEQDADQTLITQVGQLIEEKLVIEELTAEDSDVKNSEPEADGLLDFDNTNKSSAVSRWLYAPLLSLIMLALIVLLGYQLWMKQTTSLLESPQLAITFAPIKQQLKKVGVILPERRNLNQLELLSARTEAHPTRSSTILLRASLVNRARISQAFPWLELSLTDEDGRLVSRRALSPTDYLHNNRLDNVINANELKQVTIELLSFPKQAHGFELRLLNK